MAKTKFSGHHVIKVAYRNGWRKREVEFDARNLPTRRPWEHPELGTLIGSGTYNANAPWIHRDLDGNKVGEYPRMIDALAALHPEDPDTGDRR